MDRVYPHIFYSTLDKGILLLFYLRLFFFLLLLAFSSTSDRDLVENLEHLGRKRAHGLSDERDEEVFRLLVG